MVDESWSKISGQAPSGRSWKEQRPPARFAENALNLYPTSTASGMRGRPIARKLGLFLTEGSHCELQAGFAGSFSYEPYATALARYVNERGLVNSP